MTPHLSRRSLAGLLAVLGAFGPIATAARPKAEAADEDDDALPNLFISPAGQPFRARPDAPYPVSDWFRAADKDGDGRLDRGEFVADSAAFFKTLDLNGDGVLGRPEIANYEQRICPEILSRRYQSANDRWMGARLWLAQVHAPAPIDPSGDHPPPEAAPPAFNESGQGAAPYGLLDEPEPVLAADLDLTGLITRKNFLKLADMHFDALDDAKVGYLTLASLPKTKAEVLLGKDKPRRR